MRRVLKHERDAARLRAEIDVQQLDDVVRAAEAAQQADLVEHVLWRRQRDEALERDKWLRKVGVSVVVERNGFEDFAE